MRISKPYKTHIDTEFKGRFWPTGIVRMLTDEEAKPLLDSGRIYLYSSEPKRLVKVAETGEVISWGEYLKRKHKARRNRQGILDSSK